MGHENRQGNDIIEVQGWFANHSLLFLAQHHNLAGLTAFDFGMQHIYNGTDTTNKNVGLEKGKEISRKAGGKYGKRIDRNH